MTWGMSLGERLYTLVVGIGVLAIIGMVYLIKQHREKSKQKQQEQGNNTDTKTHGNDRKW